MTKRVLTALCYASLTSCAPTFDVQLRNDTGHTLVVATPLGKPPDIGIASGAAAPVDILVAPNGIMERFSVMAPHDSWTYSITSTPSWPYLHRCVSSATLA